MELTKIKGNTYYINGPTNIGVYSYKNKNCLLIDSGKNNSASRKIEEVLKQNKLHIKSIINTHSHIDHCGGNSYFKNNYTGCLVYTSSKEKVYMENIELHPSMIFSAFPMKELQEDFKSIVVDHVLDYGITKINDEKFEIICLKGHSSESIGIVTSDKVCFLGDSIFSNSILDKYSFPYLFNIEDSINTLKAIRDIDADYFVISHAEDVILREQLMVLIDRNINNIEKYLKDITELLEKPLTKEELMENIVVLNDLSLDLRQYYLNFSSLSAFLTYLYEKKLIAYTIENGKLYFYK